VAKRADVLVARRRLGFVVEGRRELFVVVQSDLAHALDTVVVAPLDDDAPMYRSDPLVVPVSAREAGSRGPQVVLVHMISAALIDRFEVGASGRLSSRSMAQVSRTLRSLLEL
jgi:mRNA-degrading endonuclease toxin of MazEF toxin-antitoxin module